MRGGGSRSADLPDTRLGAHWRDAESAKCMRSPSAGPLKKVDAMLRPTSVSASSSSRRKEPTEPTEPMSMEQPEGQQAQSPSSASGSSASSSASQTSAATQTSVELTARILQALRRSTEQSDGDFGIGTAAPLRLVIWFSVMMVAYTGHLERQFTSG